MCLPFEFGVLLVAIACEPGAEPVCRRTADDNPQYLHATRTSQLQCINSDSGDLRTKILDLRAPAHHLPSFEECVIQVSLYITCEVGEGAIMYDAAVGDEGKGGESDKRGEGMREIDRERRADRDNIHDVEKKADIKTVWCTLFWEANGKKSATWDKNQCVTSSLHRFITLKIQTRQEFLKNVMQGNPGSILGRVAPNFRIWESCRAVPLVGRFSWGSRVSPTPSFRHCSILTSITLIGSEDLTVKSWPNFSTPTSCTSLSIPTLSAEGYTAWKSTVTPMHRLLLNFQENAVELRSHEATVLHNALLHQLQKLFIDEGWPHTVCLIIDILTTFGKFPTPLMHHLHARKTMD
ncbi:hypothetical protein PR048_012871 [Dryococelus australis]|uniref:Uncharacterized protein n=1 Tax=Dryococelus australis TaxID=614101 RepID=A0ABQ9HRD8_9NEOP|nr:hypothetical protein PR048_012871 [Dryococelus australis]